MCLICWAIPINTLAKTAEPEEQIIVFPNYEKHREVELATKVQTPKPKSVNKKSVPKSTGTQNGYVGKTYSKEEVQDLIIRYSQQYGINPEVPLCIAKHESGYNQFSKNKSSSASGVFQYLTSTWESTDEGKAGLSVFDAEANIKAAIKHMASRKSTQPWEVRNKCPKL